MESSLNAGHLTPKQEAFCLAYIETGSASEAFRHAYDCQRMQPQSIHRKAKGLLDHGKIRARLSELRAPVAQRHHITVDSLLVELEQARLVALAKHSPAAAISATMSKAKLMGLDKPVPPPPKPKDITRPDISKLDPMEAARAYQAFMAGENYTAPVKVDGTADSAGSVAACTG